MIGLLRWRGRAGGEEDLNWSRASRQRGAGG
jgi:hypothetical protein